MVQRCIEFVTLFNPVTAVPDAEGARFGEAT
jgi:hypothetical protein